jgi:hypothetical protein
LLRRGDAQEFASELNLDSGQTRQWFDGGFRQDGYGAEVVRALGTLVLTQVLRTADDTQSTLTVARDSDPQIETSTPRWVKVFGIIFFAVVLLFLILLFTRGAHRGPGDHMSRSHTSSRSH